MNKKKKKDENKLPKIRKEKGKNADFVKLQESNSHNLPPISASDLA